MIITIQKWQGFKSCDCIIRGQFMKIKERQKFKVYNIGTETFQTLI